jgi:hypothetical protein
MDENKSQDLTREVFKGTTLSDIFKEIHSNSKNKRKQIEILIDELKPYISSVTDAIQLIPMIKDYLDVSVKNDELLIKMTAIVQKTLATETKLSAKTGESGDSMLTDEEKDQLLKNYKESIGELKEESSDVDKQILGIKESVDDVKLKFDIEEM